VAKYNFSPTESNQLPLKEGCKLKILSKEGDQKGWWKGQIGDKVIKITNSTSKNSNKILLKNLKIYLNTLFSDWVFSKSVCSRTF